MKKVLCILALLFIISCKKVETQKESLYPKSLTEKNQSPIEMGEEIFNGKGNCVACHQVSQAGIGPSVISIAKIYKDKNANMVAFLKGEGEPIVDPSQYEVMKTNFAITKAMSDEELKGLEAYIYSNVK